MTRENEILMRVLGETDAVWTPIRCWTGPTAPAVFHARERFAEAGTPWASGGADPAERKAVERAKATLTRRRLLKAYRPNRGRTIGVGFTLAGETIARRLAGTPTIFSSWLTCHELAGRSKRPGEAKLIRDVWIAEAELIGTGLATAALVETLLLPALATRYAESASDAAGRASYALTSRGWAWLDAGIAPPDDSEAPHDPEARALYLEKLDAALARFATAALENPREIGPIPLPVATERLCLGAWGASLTQGEHFDE
jgi:hypothetical protein